MPTKIEITAKTFLFATGIVAGFWFLIQIRQVILLLFISLILVSALHAPVDLLEKRKVPRVVAILLLYILILAAIFGILAIIIPPFVEQTNNLISRLPVIFEAMNKFITYYQIPTADIAQRLSTEIGKVGGNLFRITQGVLSTFLGIITLLVLTFYLLLEWKRVINLLASAFSGKQEKRIKKLLNDVQAGLGAWVRGELILMIIVGALSYLGLFILGIPSALPLAVFAGLLEIIPIIGPIIAAVPAILTGLSVSPILAIAVAALYFIIQQLENNLIVPNVMSKAVGINPLVTLIALMIGANLLGIMGAILVVPIVVAAKIIIADLFSPAGEEVPED